MLLNMPRATDLDSSLKNRYVQATAAAKASIETSKLEIDKEVRRICSQSHYNGDITNFEEMTAFASQQSKSLQSKLLHTASMDIYLSEVTIRYEHALEAYKTQQNFTTLNRLYREVYRAEHSLPVYVHRRELENAVRAGRFVVVEGEVGAGKSTQLPQYLADMDEFSESIIICTQPRRIAAQTLAKRVSQEFRAGAPQAANLVCYATSWSQISEQKPRICYLTESTFLSLLTSKHADLIFKQIGAVVVDEVHERTIYTDVILGLLKTSPVCSHVKVIASSATLDQVSVRRYLNNCPLISIPGGLYKVDIGYSKDDTNYLLGHIVGGAIKQVKRIIKGYPPGDILCFLTSEYEVEWAKRQLELLNDPSIIALRMYGRLDPDDMKSAFEPAPAKMRKVIFATNVAETSLTIEGLTYVIDMGLCKSVVYSPKRNLNSLRVMPISQSSANQRKGRIGRTKEGVCFRMYSERQFELFEKENQPEIRQRSLDVTLAYLLSLNVNPYQFPWMNAPDPDNVLQSLDLLKIHGAIDSNVKVSALPSHPSAILTPLGRLVVSLQMDAGIVAGIDYARKQGILEAGIILASVAAHSDNIRYSGGDERQKARDNHMKLVVPGGELVSYFSMYLHWRAIKTHRQKTKWCVDNSVNSNTMFSILENTREMQKTIGATLPISHAQPDIPPESVPTELLQKVLLCMNKDKFAVQLRPNEFLVFGLGIDKRGITASLHQSSLLLANSSQLADVQWVVFHKLLTTNRTHLMQLTPVTRDMVLEVCGTYPAQLMDKWTGSSKLVQIIKRQISPRIQIELFGENGKKREALINELQCHDIENSLEELTITLWAASTEAHFIEAQLDKSLSDIRSELLKQAKIVNLGGSNVRLLVGAGLNVVELLAPDRILFESLPDTSDKETIEKILSLHLNSQIRMEKVESSVVEVIRSKYFKGAIVVFSSVRMADCVKSLLERCPEILEGVCGKWQSARSNVSLKPQISKIEVVLGLAPTVDGRAIFKNREKAQVFSFRSKYPTANPMWRTLQVFPPARSYEFIIKTEPQDDEQTIRNRYARQKFPQPDQLILTRKYAQGVAPIQFDPLVVFPPVIEDLIYEIGIPLTLYSPTYDRAHLLFREQFWIEKHADFPIQQLDDLKQGLIRLRTHGALQGTPTCHIHKTWSLRLTLPAELAQVRKECLDNILTAFKSESVNNECTLRKNLEDSNDLVYDCFSDDDASLQMLQQSFNSKVCTPEKSEAVSPKFGQSELGRKLLHQFHTEFPNCLLQNSILHIWPEPKASVGQCLKRIRELERVLEKAQEGRYRISSSQAHEISDYIYTGNFDILHFAINGDELGIWGHHGSLERTFVSMTQRFQVTKIEALSDSQQSKNRNISAATSSFDPGGPIHKLCVLCGTTLTNQEFTTLDICADQFHTICLQRYIETESGRSLISCPRRCGLITYPEVVKLSKSIPHITKKATDFFFRFQCDPTSIGLEKHSPR